MTNERLLEEMMRDWWAGNKPVGLWDLLCDLSDGEPKLERITTKKEDAVLHVLGHATAWLYMETGDNCRYWIGDGHTVGHLSTRALAPGEMETAVKISLRGES